MSCGACGFPTSEQATFCANCGFALKEGATSPYQHAASPTPLAKAAETAAALGRNWPKVVAAARGLTPRNKITLGLIAAVIGFGNFGVARPALHPFLILIEASIVVVCLYGLVLGVVQLVKE